jgi:hypothetical protein
MGSRLDAKFGFRVNVKPWRPGNFSLAILSLRSLETATIQSGDRSNKDRSWDRSNNDPGGDRTIQRRGQVQYFAIFAIAIAMGDRSENDASAD